MTQIQKLELQKEEYALEVEVLKKKIQRLKIRVEQISKKLLPALDNDIKNLTELGESVPRKELDSSKILKEIQSTGSSLFQKDKSTDLG